VGSVVFKNHTLNFELRERNLLPLFVKEFWTFFFARPFRKLRFQEWRDKNCNLLVQSPFVRHDTVPPGTVLECLCLMSVLQ